MQAVACALLRQRPATRSICHPAIAYSINQPPTLLKVHTSALQILGQRKRASAFAVLDANGVFEEVRQLQALAEAGRQEWAQHQRQRQE